MARTHRPCSISKIFPLYALLLTAVAYLLYRRWLASFHAVEVADVALCDRAGAPRAGKRVRVQSVFDAPPDAVWDRVTTPALLMRVTRPVLAFRPAGEAPLPETWSEGDTVALHLYALGLVSVGPHTVHVVRVDRGQREIWTEESGDAAEVWSHHITVAPHPGGRTLYTDEVDIYAGERTWFIAGFARLFYCYRQTRWRAVVQEINAALS